MTEGEQPPPRILTGTAQGSPQLGLQLVEGLPHHGQHDGRLVGEVPVDRRGGDPDPAGHRPQRDGALGAGLVEQFDRRRHDVLAQTGTFPAAVAGADWGCTRFVSHGVSLQVKTYDRQPLWTVNLHV